MTNVKWKMENGRRLHLKNIPLAIKALDKLSLLRTALLLMGLIRLVAPVHAHPVPFSILDLRLSQNQGQLEGSLVAHVSYLARDLNVTPAETLLDPVTLESKKDAILTLLRPSILLAADGQPDRKSTRLNSSH